MLFLILKLLKTILLTIIHFHVKEYQNLSTQNQRNSFQSKNGLMKLKRSMRFANIISSSCSESGNL